MPASIVLVRRTSSRRGYVYPIVRIPVVAYRRAGIGEGDILRVYAADGVIVLAKYRLSPEDILVRVVRALRVGGGDEAKGA